LLARKKKLGIRHGATAFAGNFQLMVRIVGKLSQEMFHTTCTLKVQEFWVEWKPPHFYTCKAQRIQGTRMRGFSLLSQFATFCKTAQRKITI